MPSVQELAEGVEPGEQVVGGLGGEPEDEAIGAGGAVAIHHRLAALRAEYADLQ